MSILINLQKQYDAVVAAEFEAHPLGDPQPLQEDDLARLPEPVRRYVRATGAVGRPRPRNVRVEFDAGMRRRPGDRPMPSTSIQYNFFDRPTRLFTMKARIYGLPVGALHLYREEAATFQVRVASLVNVVDLKGEGISRTETVTVLNDLCFFAPGALADPRVTWEAVDDRTAVVRFANGPHRVSATLLFNDADELVDFWSDDRPEGGGGVLRQMRWNTPIDDYRDVDGRHVGHHGLAVYAYPDGPFTYGDFRLRSVAYDVAGPTPW